MPVIDGWVNLAIGGGERRPEYLERVRADYLKQDEDDFFRRYGAKEMLERMDRLEVERAILTTAVRDPDEAALRCAKEHPDRFSLSPQLDPTQPMKAVRALTRFVESHGAAMCRIVPFLHDVPPNDAVYYPVYTKCVELGLPIGINTGIPGPPAPGECQHPMHLDRVCLHFPDLVIVMSHGADPWWGEASRLLIKYANLYLMTSAYLAKYLPPDFVHFMNTRGQHKVMFASDHPALPMERAVEEARALELRPGVSEKFLYENAKRVFFGG